MKTRKDELDELIDVVIKLTWIYTVFRALFAKEDADSEIRHEHPEFFLTMHDSLFCSFCVATAILFEEKEKATSLWTLIRNSKPQVAKELAERVHSHNSSIKKIEAMRQQVCAHRWQAKAPQEVFAEVKLCLNTMAEIMNLARFLILELAADVDGKIKSELEKQQLSDSTLGCVAEDAGKVMRALRSS